MEEPAYAYGVFKKHFDRVLSLRTLDSFVGLELGPGDSLLSAMIAYAFGASAYYLGMTALKNGARRDERDTKS